MKKFRKKPVPNMEIEELAAEFGLVPMPPPAPPLRWRLAVVPNFILCLPDPRPNWWWRWWQWALLGFTWRKYEPL